MQSRLIVLCLENNGKGYAKSNTLAIPIYEEVEIAVKAEGLFYKGIIEERNGKEP